MRSFSKCAACALWILSLPLVVFGFEVATSAAARAERPLEDSSGSAIKIFDSSSERAGERSSRRARAARGGSDDDQPATSRRRTRVASQPEGDDEPAPARRRARAVAQSSGDEIGRASCRERV